MKKIKITNYTIYENENKLYFEISKYQVEKYPFEITDAYISYKELKKGIFFISDKLKENMIVFKNMNKKDLELLKQQSELIVALVDEKGVHSAIYQFDLKKIK